MLEKIIEKIKIFFTGNNEEVKVEEVKVEQISFQDAKNYLTEFYKALNVCATKTDRLYFKGVMSSKNDESNLLVSVLDYFKGIESTSNICNSICNCILNSRLSNFEKEKENENENEFKENLYIFIKYILPEATTYTATKEIKGIKHSISKDKRLNETHCFDFDFETGVIWTLKYELNNETKEAIEKEMENYKEGTD